MVKKIQAVWSSKADSDLKTIYDNHSDKAFIKRTIKTIVANADELVFAEQYQEDEILGLPYRRFFYKHWKIVYKPKNNFIQIFRVFDTRKDPNAIL